MRSALLLCLAAGCGSSSTVTIDAAPPGIDGAVIAPGAACTLPVAPVDTSSPDHLITTCDGPTLAAAVAAGGTIAFSCGGPVTIPITATLVVPTDRDTTIDGGGMVTLDGGGATQILSFDHTGSRTNTHTLTLQHLKLIHGHNQGTIPYAAAPSPCSQGYYDGFGGAVRVRDGELVVIDCAFEYNEAEALGPDVGGGAIALDGSLRAVVESSSFTANKASNGPAILAQESDLDVYDSTFSGNVAEGNGGNMDYEPMCKQQAMNGQHQVGSGGDGGAISIVGDMDGTHTFCGDTFSANAAGFQAFGGAIYRTMLTVQSRQLVIDRSTFTNNQATVGGVGFFQGDTMLSITASTFDHNLATGSGGVFEGLSLVADFTNDTFSNNSAQNGTGGVLDVGIGGGTIAFSTFAENQAGGATNFGAAINSAASLTLTSSLFDNNLTTDPDVPMQCNISSSGTGDGNLQWPRNRAVGGAPDTPCTPTVTFADPMLGPLADNGGPTQTRLPAAGSPAIGAGVSCPAMDQRGNTRAATGCTSGAVEGSQ
jgi:hypothetical protein